MQHLNMNSFASKLEKKVGLMAVATIYDYDILPGGIARIVCGFSRKVAPAEARAAIALAFDDQASAVEHSFRMIPGAKDYRPIMAGYIQSNRVVREYEESDQYRVMATNILMDKTDESLWSLATSPTGARYLTRQDNEDLSELLSMAKVRDVSIPTIASLASDLKDNEYISYVDAESASVRFGYAIEAGVTTATVLSRDNGKTTQVLKEMVVEVANMNGSDRKRSIASANSDMVSYYKELYSYDPDFFKKLEEIINDRASA